LGLRIPGLRHSAENVAGIVFFGRMVDKIRLHAESKLPPDYKRGIGTDGRVCRFLHVEYQAVVARVLDGACSDSSAHWPNDK
jgi:gluconokinase